jgi:hypothetical protein
MRRFAAIAVSIALAATIVAGAVAAVRLVAPREERATPTFRISGNVRGLYPGARTTYRARVVNRFDHPIRVRRVTARISSPTAACPSSSVSVKPWRGRLRIPPHAKRRVRLVVRMRPTAPNGCQGVRFAISYDGKAVRA